MPLGMQSRTLRGTFWLALGAAAFAWAQGPATPAKPGPTADRDGPWHATGR